MGTQGYGVIEINGETRECSGGEAGVMGETLAKICPGKKESLLLKQKYKIGWIHLHRDDFETVLRQQGGSGKNMSDLGLRLLK